MTRGEWCDLDCPQCKQPYQGDTGVKLGEIGLKRIEEADEVSEEMLASMCLTLGDAYIFSGGANRARELLERALVIVERIFGGDHVSVASTLNSLTHCRNPRHFDSIEGGRYSISYGRIT